MISKKIITYSIITIFILSLIPIFAISFYNYPSADDYIFGTPTYQEWNTNHSVMNIIRLAAQNAHDRYLDWQGTYSAIFLMSIQPGIFATKAYALVPFIVIISLVLSYLWFTKILIREYCKGSKYDWLIICTSLLILSITFAENKVEAFYWYNGAVFYGFYFALSLCMFSCLMKAYKTKKHIYTILSALLAIIIAGGNLSSGLLIPLILITAMAYTTIIERKKVSWPLVITTLIFLIGFVINITAPGNTIRQNHFTETPSPLHAILLALQQGRYNISKWLNLSVFLVFLTIIPIVYNLTKKCSYTFKYPLLFTLISFGLYCSMYVPPYFAMGFMGPGRLINICKYAFYWLILFNIFYYCGYVCHRNILCNKKISEINHTLIQWGSKCRYLMYVLIIILFTTIILKSRSTTKMALDSLMSGEAKTYNREMSSRISLYNSDAKGIVVPKLSVKPIVLFYEDVTPDKNHWINEGVAKYFKKDYVVLEE